jgi:hypothetical protein
LKCYYFFNFIISEVAHALFDKVTELPAMIHHNQPHVDPIEALKVGHTSPQHHQRKCMNF